MLFECELLVYMESKFAAIKIKWWDKDQRWHGEEFEYSLGFGRMEIKLEQDSQLF